MGSLEGVLSTRSVWVGQREVVHLTYDPQVIEFAALLKHARQMECTAAVYTSGDDQLAVARQAGLEEVREWDDSLETRQVRKAEQKYYLRNTIYAHLPLTELQAVRMNAALGDDTGQEQPDPPALDGFLSPRQRQLLKRIRRARQQDRQSLDGFGFPEDEAELEGYTRKLREKLDELEV